MMREIYLMIGCSIEAAAIQAVNYSSLSGEPCFFRFNDIHVECKPGMAFNEVVAKYKSLSGSGNTTNSIRYVRPSPSTAVSDTKPILYLEWRKILIERAEKLLAMSPGSFSSKSLAWVKERIQNMYDLEKDIPSVGERSQRLMVLMWNWLGACEYAQSIKENLKPDPSMIGIESLSRIEEVTIITVPCIDHDHFLHLPSEIYFKGQYLGKGGFNIGLSRCVYRSDDSSVKSLNERRRIA